MAESRLGDTWRVVNDGVMGGQSSGAGRIEAGVLLYDGVINTDGGGFSIPPGEPGQWHVAEVDLAALDARLFGRRVDTADFRPELATVIGVILSDGVDGPFALELDWIDACG